MQRAHSHIHAAPLLFFLLSIERERARTRSVSLVPFPFHPSPFCPAASIPFASFSFPRSSSVRFHSTPVGISRAASLARYSHFRSRLAPRSSTLPALYPPCATRGGYRNVFGRRATRAAESFRRASVKVRASGARRSAAGSCD